MSKKKVTHRVLFISLIFIVYFIIAAKPVPREIILEPKWINSLETEDPIILSEQVNSGNIIPFTLGYHFGYIDTAGQFAINRFKSNQIGLSKNMWTEYDSEPTSITINNIQGEPVINIENVRGYPVLLDSRIFIIGSEMNSLTEIDANGKEKWSYEFGSILTDIDVAAGLVVTASIDGIIEILNDSGERIFYFQPGGSRLEIIYGCAISRNGSRIGVISGYDPQRFLLLERLGTDTGDFRVIYHEFLDKGFRRPVRVAFIDNDSRVIYERQNGITCYNIRSRQNIFIPLDGELVAIDDSGTGGRLFLITRQIRNPSQKELVGIRFPPERGIRTQHNSVFLRAPFTSDNAFLGRVTGTNESILIVGGGNSLIAFNLEEK